MPDTDTAVAPPPTIAEVAAQLRKTHDAYVAELDGDDANEDDDPFDVLHDTADLWHGLAIDAIEALERFTPKPAKCAAPVVVVTADDVEADDAHRHDAPCHLECGNCGSDEFVYRENVIEERWMSDNEGTIADGGTVKVVWEIGCGGESGDSDPGLICRSCETIVDLPDDWELDFA